MSKLLLLYVFAILLMLAGLLSLYYSFRKPTAKEKMIKAMMPPPPVRIALHCFSNIIALKKQVVGR
jgi:hypothetical protein